jgi:hypothetical protein
MGALPQALEIVFEVQKSNEKITRRKISFSNYKNIFVFVFSLCPPTFKAHNFLISCFF